MDIENKIEDTSITQEEKDQIFDFLDNELSAPPLDSEIFNYASFFLKLYRKRMKKELLMKVRPLHWVQIEKWIGEGEVMVPKFAQTIFGGHYTLDYWNSDKTICLKYVENGQKFPAFGGVVVKAKCKDIEEAKQKAWEHYIKMIEVAFNFE